MVGVPPNSTPRCVVSLCAGWRCSMLHTRLEIWRHRRGFDWRNFAVRALVSGVFALTVNGVSPFGGDRTGQRR